MPSSKQLADKQVKSSSGFGLTKQQTAMVVVLLLGAVLVVLNQTLLSPALPTIMSDMQVDATTVQWLTSGYALVEAIIIPLNAFSWVASVRASSLLAELWCLPLEPLWRH